MNVTEPIEWRKSTHSDHQGGDCVELGRLSTTIAVRDSKNPNVPPLTFDHTTFRTFAQKIRSEPGR